MAQAGFTPISLFYSSVAGNVPAAGQLLNGELALNIADGNIFYKNSGGAVVPFTGPISNVVPGAITMYGSSAAPSGYILCNGQAVSRTTYAVLFGVIGSTYGAGDGTTTFNVPNFNNQFPVGAGASYAAGQTGGQADSTLPAHVHNTIVNDPGHQHGYRLDANGAPCAFGANQGNVGGPTVQGGTGGQTSISSGTESSTTSISVAVQAAGNSPVGTNIPPFLGVYFIIKT